MIRIIVTAISSFCVFISISAQPISPSLAFPNDTIEFRYNKHNNIVIDAILNDVDTVALMFHTAIGSVSLTPEMTKLLASKEKKSNNSRSWIGSKEVSYTEDNSLRISNLIWENLLVYIDLLSGPETDGKFGPNLFKNKVIEINNDKKIIVIHESEGLEIDATKFSKFKLASNENNSMFLEGELTVNNQTIKNDFLIHSGFGGTIILDNHFCRMNPVFHQLETIEEKELKDSFGNIIKTKKVKLDTFKFCGLSFVHVPISYFDSKIDIQKTSVIGCDILRRCNLILDIPNLEIHISSNNQTNHSFKS